ncbi:SDR family oxidoreductase [Alkalihalobacillus sp. AL-G]|uniref:SDR family oxidoreductase n=1 Tax=Alkalihalobacillus sp. AL-G TaxID=2926399 RepID=UPI00272AD019|nr:SDR family oxidoreductase [Alkalihalobacillus sp. AL-G]WLD93825.1 SDR family oxidoreductase [Alkalihalobacillus sp. AL-G]
MENLLSNKTAIVSGAASGMGKSIAQTFVKYGANVTLTDLNREGLESASASCNPDQIKLVKANVSKDEDFASLIGETIETFNGLDIIVNCAGVPQSFTPIEELSEEQWDRIMDVNLKSIYLSAKHAVPFMKNNQKGTIINIASIAGVRARPGLNAYCASKGAALMLTKSLALELAPHKIRVNAINPGPTETPMINQFLPGNEADIDGAKKKIFVDSVPLGSLIQPEDIAYAALYLASDQAKSVTGEILNVDGGRGV